MGGPQVTETLPRRWIVIKIRAWGQQWSYQVIVAPRAFTMANYPHGTSIPQLPILNSKFQNGKLNTSVTACKVSFLGQFIIIMKSWLIYLRLVRSTGDSSFMRERRFSRFPCSQVLIFSIFSSLSRSLSISFFISCKVSSPVHIKAFRKWHIWVHECKL